MIRPVTLEDTQSICAIYNHYVEHTTITFEYDPVSEKIMQERIQENLDLELPWLVYEEEGKLLGFAYAKKWKERFAYRFAVESTIYLKDGVNQKGLGTKLYTQLREALKSKGIHAMVGGVTLPNPPSVAFHEKLGFTKVAQFKEVGFKFDQWLDVGYWEMILD